MDILSRTFKLMLNKIDLINEQKSLLLYDSFLISIANKAELCSQIIYLENWKIMHLAKETKKPIMMLIEILLQFCYQEEK